MQPTDGGPRRNRLVSGLFRFVMTLLVLGLLGLVGYLAAERNARTFALEVQDGQLIVMKGRKLPIGADPWRPEDPVQAEAYAPIPLNGHVPSEAFLEETYAERDELDRALFELLERQARPRIASEDPREQERGVYFLRRAALLQGLTGAQRESLAAMQAEVAWYQAKLKLEQARQLVVEAMAQLDLAMQSKDPNAARARSLANRLAAPARQLEVALRNALGGTGAETVPPGARLEGEQVEAAPVIQTQPETLELETKPSQPDAQPDAPPDPQLNTQPVPDAQPAPAQPPSSP